MMPWETIFMGKRMNEGEVEFLYTDPTYVQIADELNVGKSNGVWLTEAEKDKVRAEHNKRKEGE